MRKYAIAFCICALSLAAGGCTQNQRARALGGKETVEIPKGQKLVNCSWKDNDLWILSRPMREGEEAETWSYKAKSSFGLLEGEVILKESK